MLSIPETRCPDSALLRDKMDVLEGKLAQIPQANYPLFHHFTPGLYVREGRNIPAGTLLTSRVHKTEHPFVISKGVIQVITEDGKRETLRAPHFEITTPGKRRWVLVLEEAVLMTFHPTTKTNPVEIGEEITYCDNEHIPNDFIQSFLGQPGEKLICGR
jgi:hypothetical protein